MSSDDQLGVKDVVDDPVVTALRDVQDSMGHRDARTTRLYDRTRANHTRNATYAVAAVLADV